MKLLLLLCCINRFMFWTDWGNTPKIERSTLNGTHRVTIVTSNLHWPMGIDLDRRNQMVFWVDASLSRVESVDYHGNNRKLLYQRALGLHHFSGVTFFSPYLYVTELYSNTIFRLNATYLNQGSITQRVHLPSKLNGLVAYDSSRQPPG